MVELSILIPCFNDAKVLPETLATLNGLATHYYLNIETLIIDDESDDDTLAVAQRLVERFPALHIRVLARKRLRRGFGAVVRYGMAYSDGRYCALVSSDGQDPVALLPEFIAKLRAGAQLVQCTRYVRKQDEVQIPLSFRIYQYIYRLLVRCILRERISDTTYGFRAFDRIFIQSLGTSATRFNICPEITFKAVLSGGKIEYIPGKPRPFNRGGSVKFQLPYEIGGYAYVLLRAALHKWRILRWF